MEKSPQVLSSTGVLLTPTESQLPSVLRELRERTRPQHDAIEQLVDVMRPDLTREQYRSLVARFYSFYSPLEARLQAVHQISPLLPDFERRRKTGRLLQDLQAIGMTAPQIDDLRLCTNLPQLDSQAQAMGCLYVLEGATLGGQFISRHVSQTLNITPETGGAFFSSYGEELGSMWRAFGSQMSLFDQDLNAREQIITSAQHTFRALHLWLT